MALSELKITSMAAVIITREAEIQFWYKILPVLIHWGRDEIDAALQTTFSNAFSWMKMYEFRLEVCSKGSN